jgi:GNAT superfamily N-acetyltransferase
MSDVRVRPMTAGDWDRVRTIYEQGLATGNATFETTAPSWPAWDASHLVDDRLVAGADGELLGWAALSPVSDRCVYAGVAENSVYVAETGRSRGIGRLLLEALIKGAEAAGIWTIQNRDLPGEHRQPPPPRSMRLPDRRCARAHRTPPRTVAQHRLSRTTQPAAVTET